MKKARNKFISPIVTRHRNSPNPIGRGYSRWRGERSMITAGGENYPRKTKKKSVATFGAAGRLILEAWLDARVHQPNIYLHEKTVIVAVKRRSDLTFDVLLDDDSTLMCTTSSSPRVISRICTTSRSSSA